MVVAEVIRNRRSIRHYIDKDVEIEKIYKIIEAGQWAPTATNKQEARFIYINDKEKIQSLCKNGTAQFVRACNQMILVLYDNRIDNIEYHDDILSGAAVIQNMLLQAEELGVSTCWVANLPAKSILRKLFSIPAYYDPISLITLGYAIQQPKDVERKHSLENIIFRNEFDQSRDIKPEKNTLRLFIRKALRMIYIKVPKNQWTLSMVSKYEKKFFN